MAGRPPKEVWRPRRFRSNPGKSTDDIPDLRDCPPLSNRSTLRRNYDGPPGGSQNSLNQPNKRNSGKGNSTGVRDDDFKDIRRGPHNIGNDSETPSSSRNIIERWLTQDESGDSWRTASKRKSGKSHNNEAKRLPDPSLATPDRSYDGAVSKKTNFNPTTSNISGGVTNEQSYCKAASSRNFGRYDHGGGAYSRSGGTQGRGGGAGGRRGDFRSSMVTKLASLEDWTALSTFESPVRIMLKLQEFESDWIALFHTNASFEVIDIAFDLFNRIDERYKYGKLGLMKSLFTAPFFKRLMEVLTKLKGTWFSSGKDKILSFIERIRLNVKFILSNDPAFHDDDSSKALISSLIEECVSLLTHINTKLLDLQGTDDVAIGEAVSKIRELFDIQYIEMQVLEESVYPDDFRNTYAVMPNQVNGAYESDDHYVQTHFGLLKEDFQSALREGVEQYLVDPKQKNFKIWAYENVIVVRDLGNKNDKKVLFRVTFPECKYFSRVQWKYVKRFMFGSLVVLTANKFDTYYLAMIEDRNFDKPESISIVISFISSPPNTIEETKLLLVEPKVFFEPYLHSMKVLKHMAKIGLPLKKYVVNADTTPALPAYINNDSSYRIGNHDIKINNILSWPRAEDLGLNRSQREAFINALTSDMALIQGPPGTGKTFLAFKVIATLLLNKKNSYKDGPIMVVCYKNHSLDQILEGLLNKGRKIVRIGGQSKIKALKFEYNAKNLPAPPTISVLQKEKTDLESKLSSIMLCIKDIVSIINLVKSRIGIIKLELLKQFDIVDLPKDMDLPQWLMDLVSDVPQIPLHVIDQKCRSISYNKQCLLRIFGSAGLESLFLVNLYDSGKDLVEINNFLMNTNWQSCEEYEKWVEMRDLFYYDSSRYMYLAHALNPTASDCPDPKSTDFPGYFNLDFGERWALYNKWEQDFIAVLQDRLMMFQSQVSEIEENLLEYEEMVLAQKLKYERPDVIGVTTSGASKHYSALADVGAKVVLVEEAAEVLEAHVIASLSPKCQHLILIGDHQQLKPTTASYTLGTQYRMSISLFERMIRNDIKWSCLSTQHRMRPEIAALISPSIYTNLINSPNVEEYPNVIGTKKNVFFFNHNYPEQVGYDSESKFNPKEGEMLLAICFYLIRQGYDPKTITILSTYLEQDRFIKKTIDRVYNYNSSAKEVNCTVVDNYQGEENTIILLSLVRSNDFGDVGFLSTKNRVCVALSRAKHGLFIFGNMPCLSKKEPSIWSEINDVLLSQEAIGTKFPLKCKKHNNITEVESPQDVSALKNAGCSNPCETPLPCGHTCLQMCHGEDQGHTEKFSCMDKCIRKCENGHTCNAQCRDVCPPCPEKMPKVLVCGHSLKLECHKSNLQSYCIETVEIKLEKCGHNQLVLCKLTVNRHKIVCKAICLKEFTCGHICKRKCHVSEDPDHKISLLCDEPCELINKSCPRKHRCNKKCREPCGDCRVKLEKTLPCSHKALMECSQDVSTFKCKERCSRTLDCNHECVNRCDQNCGPCSVKVEKTIEECGHKLNVRCSDLATRSNCEQRCESMKSCGHQCSGICKNICEEQFCNVTVEKDLPCGHKSFIKCGHLDKGYDLSTMCHFACKTVLPCGHTCEGTCGSCLGNRIHQPCLRDCNKTLVCSHKCQSYCNEAYHSCGNSKCLKKCWQDELDNPHLYSYIKSGRGRRKTERSIFDPEERIIQQLYNTLRLNNQGTGQYLRELSSRKTIFSMIDGIHKFVLRSTQGNYPKKSDTLCRLKTCIFKIEYMKVFCVVFKRLMDSNMGSLEKQNFELLLEKLISRLSSRNGDIGGYEMQQLQEQMFWISLAIDIYNIGAGGQDEDLSFIQESLEATKSSFGPDERSTLVQLLQDFKSAKGIDVPIHTTQWNDMFPYSVQWCQPILHHRPNYNANKKENDPIRAKNDQPKTVVDDKNQKGESAESCVNLANSFNSKKSGSGLLDGRSNAAEDFETQKAESADNSSNGFCGGKVGSGILDGRSNAVEDGETQKAESADNSSNGFCGEKGGSGPLNDTSNPPCALPTILKSSDEGNLVQPSQPRIVTPMLTEKPKIVTYQWQEMVKSMNLDSTAHVFESAENVEESQPLNLIDTSESELTHLLDRHDKIQQISLDGID